MSDFYEEYDNFIGLDTFSNKSKIREYKKKIMRCLQKDRPLSDIDVGAYNKSVLPYVVGKGQYENKEKAMYAIRHGKTKEYAKKYPNDAAFKKLVTNIHSKFKIGE